MAKKKYSKVAGYMRAKRLMDEKGMSQMEACQLAGISKMTFNRYVRELGDEVFPGQVEVLPKEENQPIVEQTSSQPKARQVLSPELERILAENAALAEQVKLRKELHQLTH
jgi:transcriptional regulator with XRE-family HTH domain